MQPIDKIVFGDNQFFGINHMSQEKAQEQGERFRELRAITDVYESAIDLGVRAIMLNTHDRAGAICDYFRTNENRLPELAWYPSLPYAHKYASLVAEKGMLPALMEVLFGDARPSGIFSLLSKGGMAVLGRDEVKAMQMLIDIEMRRFHGLNIRVIFLQNIITDLLLGLGMGFILREYCNYIQRKYNVLPGLITQNLPRLLEFLENAEIAEVVVCTSFNKIGYLMSPDVDAYVQVTARNDPARYQIMAMSTLASGAIAAPEAYDFINRQKVQSVVFGASSARNIAQTIQLVRLQ